MSMVDLNVLDDGMTEVHINDEFVKKVLTVLNYSIDENDNITNLTADAANNIVKIASMSSTDKDELLLDTKLAMLSYAIGDLAEVHQALSKEKNPDINADNVFNVFMARFSDTLGKFDNVWNSVFNEENKSEDPDIVEGEEVTTGEN